MTDYHLINSHTTYSYSFWLVVWNMFYVSIYWKYSSQLTTDEIIIQRGRSTTNQI